MNVPVRPEETRTSLQQPVVRTEPVEEKKISKVTTGKVTSKAPSVGKKVLAEFLEQDANDIKEYVWKDVMIPTIKDTLCNIVELLLFGSASRGRRGGSRGGNTERTNYSSYYYSNGRGGRDERRDRDERRAPRNINDIIFETRMDAEEVISTLEETLERYGSVSIADLYDACGVTGEYTDNKWGWKSGARFFVRRVRDGYSIDMPKPTLLD